jgi:hypothetical protein
VYTSFLITLHVLLGEKTVHSYGRSRIRRTIIQAQQTARPRREAFVLTVLARLTLWKTTSCDFNCVTFVVRVWSVVIVHHGT